MACGDTSGNPCHMTIDGTGTSTVAISGTPSVAISGTPSVAVSGTATVQDSDSQAKTQDQLDAAASIALVVAFGIGWLVAK